MGSPSNRCLPRNTVPGFSLIELLVVILIITALLSLTLAALGAAREAANRTVCASRMREVARAMHLYANVHQGWILRSGGEQERSGLYRLSWTVMLDPRGLRDLDGLGLATALLDRAVMKCPEHPRQGWPTHFVGNAVAVDPSLPPNLIEIAGPVKLAAIRRASSVIFITDRSNGDASWRDPGEDEWMEHRSVNVGQADLWGEAMLPGVPVTALHHYGRRVPANRHGRGLINAAYYDGSVRTVHSLSLRLRDFDDGISPERRTNRFAVDLLDSGLKAYWLPLP